MLAAEDSVETGLMVAELLAQQNCRPLPDLALRVPLVLNLLVTNQFILMGTVLELKWTSPNFSDGLGSVEESSYSRKYRVQTLRVEP